MIQGLSKKEARLAWLAGNSVVCPGCETHIEEDDSEEYAGEIWHIVCVREDKRINFLADEHDRIYGS